MKSSFHVLLLVFSFCVLFVTSAAPARRVWAAPPSASAVMQAESHYSGHFKFGEWLPLRISLSNDGPALRAEIRADTTQFGGLTTFVVPVELPSGARKRITLYVLPPSFAREIRVRLLDTNDSNRELVSQLIPLTVERNLNYVVGVIAPRQEAFAPLAALVLKPAGDNVPRGRIGGLNARNVKALPISLNDIPDRSEGLRTLDALIISGVDTSELSVEQRRALQAWVEQGGRLILGGGVGAARTLAGMPADLTKELRAIAGATDVRTLGGLASFANENVQVSGPFVASWPTTSATLRPIITQENRALLVEQRWGEGYVDFSALDLAASPFNAWAGTARFWEKVLTPGAAWPANAPPDVSPRTVRTGALYSALQNMPVLELPSITWLTVILGIYILLVGPVNYLVLRRLKRLAWGWATIPILTLLFSIGTFAFGYAVRGSDVIVNKISILALDSQGSMPAQTYVGIFSPDRTAYTINVPGRALIAPLFTEGNPFSSGPIPGALSEVVQGEPAQVRSLQVEQWALQGFQTESPLPEGWRIESNLSLEGERVRGTVTNQTSNTIVDAMIVYGNRYVKIDNLPTGQSLTINHVLQNIGGSFPWGLVQNDFGNGSNNREVQVRQQLLNTYFRGDRGPAQPPSRPTLIGWMRSSPLDVQISGVRWTTQQMSLVVATLNAQYNAGAIRLSPGMLQAQLIGSTGEAYPCGTANQYSININNGSIVLEYQLPAELMRMVVKKMAVVTTDNSAMEMADRNGEWVKLGAARNGRIEVNEPERFVTTTDSVRLHILANAARGCMTYDLEIEGELKP